MPDGVCVGVGNLPSSRSGGWHKRAFLGCSIYHEAMILYIMALAAVRRRLRGPRSRLETSSVGLLVERKSCRVGRAERRWPISWLTDGYYYCGSQLHIAHYIGVTNPVRCLDGMKNILSGSCIRKQ